MRVRKLVTGYPSHMIVLGVLLLAAAAVVAVVGVLHNRGTSHPLGSRVEVLGYHLDGSTAKLLLAGIIVGAVGMLGLALMVAGSARRGARARALRAERRDLRAAADATAVPVASGRHAQPAGDGVAVRRHWWNRRHADPTVTAG